MNSKTKYNLCENFCVTDDEDNYAARIGRIMWRVAKRRAKEIRLYETGVLTVPVSAAERRAPESKVQQRVQRPDQERLAQEHPPSLSEFLRALAAELAQDEPDPGGS